jgi:hypothetical protein
MRVPAILVIATVVVMAPVALRKVWSDEGTSLLERIWHTAAILGIGGCATFALYLVFFAG